LKMQNERIIIMATFPFLHPFSQAKIADE